MKKVLTISLALNSFLYAEVFELGVIEVSAKKEQKADSNVVVVDQQNMQKIASKELAKLQSKHLAFIYKVLGVQEMRQI